MNASLSRSGFAGLFAGAAGLFAAVAPAAAAGKIHRVAFHIDQNDPAIINLLLNNFTNLADYYAGIGDTSQVEIVAYSAGLHIFRADTSPVKERLTALRAKYPTVVFSACHNTMMGMEKSEGHPIEIVPEARVVPAGVVRLAELQELQYAYIKP